MNYFESRHLRKFGVPYTIDREPITALKFLEVLHSAGYNVALDNPLILNDTHKGGSIMPKDKGKDKPVK